MDTGKIIDILNTRDPDKIQKELDKYPKLHTISRDRGYSYKGVSKECHHVVDRFHLIMNLSEAITKEIKMSFLLELMTNITYNGDRCNKMESAKLTKSIIM